MPVGGHTARVALPPMDIDDARQLGVALIGDHGLHGWRLVFDRAKTRAGICRFEQRTIGLSRVLTELHGTAEVRDTILHEIAHALVGPAHGHDAVWRSTALAIGCSGRRCMAEDVAVVPGAWVGTCPSGHRVTRHRQPTRVYSCRRCAAGFDPDALFTWCRHGRQMPLHPRYQAELDVIGRRRAAAQRRVLPVLPLFPDEPWQRPAG